jgi:hypothetical protein
VSFRLRQFKSLLSKLLFTKREMSFEKTSFASFSKCRAHALRRRFIWLIFFHDLKTFFETFFAMSAARSWKNLIFIRRKINMNWIFFFVNVCKSSKYVLWFIAWMSIACNTRRCDSQTTSLMYDIVSSNRWMKISFKTYSKKSCKNILHFNVFV